MGWGRLTCRAALRGRLRRDCPSLLPLRPRLSPATSLELTAGSFQAQRASCQPRWPPCPHRCRIRRRRFGQTGGEVPRQATRTPTAAGIITRLCCGWRPQAEPFSGGEGNSSRSWRMVSSGPVTVWPIVSGDSKIS